MSKLSTSGELTTKAANQR